MTNPLVKPPPYCQRFKDRHGKQRYYYRRRGYPLHPLPGLPWTPEFMAAYERAERREALNRPQKLSPEERTMSALAISYYRSGDFRNLAASSQKTYRDIIERFRTDHGHRLVAEMHRVHVQKIMTAKADTPAAANNLLRILRLLMRHAVEVGWRKDNPTEGVRRMKTRSKGYRTWDEVHIEAFVRHHKPGTRAHLALSLLVHTGQRRSDVIRMGHQHLCDGILSITQKKTGQDVHIPLHRDLRKLLDALPKDDPAFLTTLHGQPFTASGFSDYFKKMTREAGLPADLSAHGLRKATCRRLAEAGCTAHQIMAISGHRSLSEVTRYTVAAGRKELAVQAMLALDQSSIENGQTG